MAGIGFVGLSAYVFMKKYPSDSKNLLTHANGMLKYMPIDKNTSDLITPFFEFSKIKNDINNYGNGPTVSMDQQTPRRDRTIPKPSSAK